MKFFKIINNKVKSIPKYFWVLLLITVLGFFLRTYNFHDWLRFNMDQGRDATLISAVIDKDIALPLIGPRAGGTDFHLGPMSYYFQIISAKVFGNYPDKMAYPDLFFSILSIPLFFIFFRKYFSIKISLFITYLFSISFYAIYYSRFAWNPNSTPFWVILTILSIFSIVSRKNNNKTIWAIIAGLAIGVSMQLHTTLFLVLPILTVFIFVFLLIKKQNLLKYFFIIVILSLSLNIPQLIGEYKTQGENTKSFFTAITKKGHASKNGEIIKVQNKVLHNSNCWTESTLLILSGYEISDSCKIKLKNGPYDWFFYTISLIFFSGGALIGLFLLKREANWEKKSFLAIIFLYIGICYLIYIPLSFGLTMRFFIMMIFFPFMLLGFWIEFLKNKWKINYIYSMSILFVIITAMNVFFIKDYFDELEKYQTQTTQGGRAIYNVTLKEIEVISNFIINNSNNQANIYIDGKTQFVTKTLTSLRFLTHRSGINLIRINGDDEPRKKFFYLTNPKRTKKILSGEIIAEKYLEYGRFLIYLSESAD